jgi:hypothetical protein
LPGRAWASLDRFLSTHWPSAFDVNSVPLSTVIALGSPRHRGPLARGPFRGQTVPSSRDSRYTRLRLTCQPRQSSTWLRGVSVAQERRRDLAGLASQGFLRPPDALMTHARDLDPERPPGPELTYEAALLRPPRQRPPGPVFRRRSCCTTASNTATCTAGFENLSRACPRAAKHRARGPPGASSGRPANMNFLRRAPCTFPEGLGALAAAPAIGRRSGLRATGLPEPVVRRGRAPMRTCNPSGRRSGSDHFAPCTSSRLGGTRTPER